MKAGVVCGWTLWAVILACAGSSRFQPARVASKEELDYPLSAQVARIEGNVTATVLVNAEGKAEEVKITESSGHAVLDSAAFRFITTLQFDPGLLDNKPVSSWTRLILRYKLTDVVFEERRWLDEVVGLQSQINSSPAAERLEAQRKLYIRYLGLVNYVEKYKQTSINDAIRRVCLRQTVEQWRLFWEVLPIPFAVFDDFLRRYPDSELTDRIKEDLIRLLSDSEAELRVLALKSTKIARIAPELLDLISNRLDELCAGG